MRTFSVFEIRKIYDHKVKKSEHYFKLRSKLPNKSPIPSWTNPEWPWLDMPRNFAILDFKEWIIKYKIQKGQILGYTCDYDPELELVSYQKKIRLNFPKHDLHLLNPKFMKNFDFFIFNQTIEHLYNPFLALQNIHSYVKKGGYVYTTVPTINIPHETPIHFNGYNPMGLAMLFLSCDFEVCEIGQWGNSDYIKQIFKKHQWPKANQVSSVNEEKNVAQCWILARRLD